LRLYATKLDELVSIAKIVGVFILFFFIFFGFVTNWYGWLQDPITGGATSIGYLPIGDCMRGDSSEKEICLQLKRIADILENKTGDVP
jgi:hypothetical protein